MVTFENAGRLGNFLFETATALAYSIKNNQQFTVPTETNNAKWQPLYLQHLVNKEFNPNLQKMKIPEVVHCYQNIPFVEEWDKMNIFIQGYRQTEKYFIDYRTEILKAFGFGWELKNGITSIHIRRGDYVTYANLFPPITMEYLNKAMDHFISIGLNRFMVFTDDFQWAKQNLTRKDADFIFMEGNSEVQDLILGSYCEHNIISNSTFSWWQAWLGQNDSKIVVSPHENNWFAGANKKHDVSDVIPERWIKIKYS